MVRVRVAMRRQEMIKGLIIMDGNLKLIIRNCEWVELIIWECV